MPQQHGPCADGARAVASTGGFLIAVARIKPRFVEPSQLPRCDYPQHSVDKWLRGKALGLYSPYTAARSHCRKTPSILRPPHQPASRLKNEFRRNCGGTGKGGHVAHLTARPRFSFAVQVQFHIR